MTDILHILLGGAGGGAVAAMARYAVPAWLRSRTKIQATQIEADAGEAERVWDRLQHVEMRLDQSDKNHRECLEENANRRADLHIVRAENEGLRDDLAKVSRRLAETRLQLRRPGNRGRTTDEELDDFAGHDTGIHEMMDVYKRQRSTPPPAEPGADDVGK